jgi:phosphopantetheine adenylyltransferase
MQKPSPWLALMKPPQPEELMTPIPQGALPQAPQITSAPPPLQLPTKVQSASFSIPFGPTKEDLEWEQKVKEGIEERSGGIKGMQAQVDELKNKEYGFKDLDLSALSALATPQMANVLANTYKAPNTKLKDQEKIAKLEEAMQKEKGVITDDMIQLLKDKASSANARLMLDNMRQHRFDESIDLKKEDNLRKDVNKITDEYQTVQNQLNMAEQAVSAGDTRTVQMVISSIARNIGEQKGSLSDGDVQRSMPPDIATNVAQLEAYLGSNSTISPELQGAFMNLINMARSKSGAIAQESLKRRKTQYSAGAYAPLMQEGKVGNVIFNEALGPMTPSPTPPPPPGGPQGVMSPQEWLKKKRSKQ